MYRRVNRPGIDRGSQVTGGLEYGSTEEVSGRVDRHPETRLGALSGTIEIATVDPLTDHEYVDVSRQVACLTVIASSSRLPIAEPDWTRVALRMREAGTAASAADGTTSS
jgi:hypothetical protein